MNNFDDSQLTLSANLLQLLKWILEREHCSINKLINKALSNGLYEKLTNASRPNIDENYESNEDMQEYVIDFFMTLEAMLDNNIQEKNINKVVERNLIPTIDHIDSAKFDPAEVANSIAKATSNSSKDKQDPKQILYKELLRRWKPTKKLNYN